MLYSDESTRTYVGRSVALNGKYGISLPKSPNQGSATALTSFATYGNRKSEARRTASPGICDVSSPMWEATGLEPYANSYPGRPFPFLVFIGLMTRLNATRTATAARASGRAPRRIQRRPGALVPGPAEDAVVVPCRWDPA
jgi:hypothetical protein